LPWLDANAICSQQIDPRALEGVEWFRLGRGEQSQRGIERPGLEHDLRGDQRAGAAPARIWCQCRRPLQEGGRRGDAAAGLCATGGALQLAGHRLVGSLGRMGAMPRSTVGIQLRIGRVGQRPMDLPPVGHGRRPVGR